METTTFELIVTFINPLDRATSSGSSSDWLELEQEEQAYPESGGFLTWLTENNLGLTLANRDAYFEQFRSACSDDGTFNPKIYVHKSRSDLQYTITASYGELSAKSVVSETHTTSITVGLESEYDTRELITNVISAEWEGVVLDANQNSVPPPAITNEGSVLKWGVICAGTIRLKYEETHDEYTLTMKPREDADENDLATAYQSTVTAVFDGGFDQLEIEPPEMIGYCTGSSVVVDPDDPGDGTCVDRYIYVHPCTGEILSQEDVTVPC